jgi:hypothetical protein
LAPYEATFSGMGKRALRAWADQLGVPDAVRGLLAEPYDLGLVLLGNEYLEACRLADDVRLGGPTLLICGANMAKTLPRLPRLRLLALSNAEAKRFSCALIGLKGELAARLLNRLVDEPKKLFDPAQSPLDIRESAPAKVARRKTRAALTAEVHAHQRNPEANDGTFHLIERRARKADLERCGAVLAKVPDVPPAPEDTLPLEQPEGVSGPRARG